LARLEREHKGSVTVITQNIDPLHEAAGSRNPIHMHGELMKALCALCGMRHAWRNDLGLETQCPGCKEKGSMRPDVVWFGEMPYAMERIYSALAGADLFISIGTSGNVYPAAGFEAVARERRAYSGA
ncbi:MAG: Sir2 family NAD-dependent protein deacetylase, partial [Hyphomicrobium sp.]